MIIHETYVKELERVKNQMEDDAKKSHEQDVQSKLDQEAFAKKLQL